MGAFSKVLRVGEGKRVRELEALIAPINELASWAAGLSDEELKGQTDLFKARLAEGEELDDLLVDAFAVVREAATRVLGQRPYDVQLMGAMALHFGWIAEMKTGEGKTLVSTLPVYLNALAGKGVHVVTVNEYLATRDAAWMGQVHEFLGLSVGRVGADMTTPEEKRAAYNCDITYGTNTEFGFDYLRDNMVREAAHQVQRGHTYAIVDEVDSILIDEARTPLIISGPSTLDSKVYHQFASIVRALNRDADYEVDEEKQIVVPTADGIAKVEGILKIDNLYDEVAANFVHHLGQALRAKELFLRDKEYVVANGEVKIVDEFTGRILEGRRWNDGLHQAVEAKERVSIKEENHTWATVTLQNYFKMYEKLAGMTGTAETEAGEFGSTYGLIVVAIPTNRPSVRIDQPDLVFKTEEAKFAAIVEDVRERSDRGQPILLGTASVDKSELLSAALNKAGVVHEVLNAKQHFREAEIVTQAGRKGTVTVATNMAGRGVDVLLGGNPEGLAAREVVSKGIATDSEKYESAYAEALAKWKQICGGEGDEVRAAGGLYVLGTERHDSRRIDNQLRGRSGRQGDPGETRFCLSLEDELMRIFATGMVAKAMDRVVSDEAPIEAKMVSKAIERAQGTVEGKNAEARADVLKYDEVYNQQRTVLYEKRQEILDGDDIHAETLEAIAEELESAVLGEIGEQFSEDWNLDVLIAEISGFYPTSLTVEKLVEIGDVTSVVEAVQEEALALYEKKCEDIDAGGVVRSRGLERDIMLQMLDIKWREHLSAMDYMRDGITWRQVAQQDPLTAWKREGFWLFEQMLDSVTRDYVKFITHVDVTAVVGSQQNDTGLAGASTNTEEVGGDNAEAVKPKGTTVRRTSDKIGRNEPCWCGSGRKFKNCHGRPGVGG
jgi:preprotein translocase subunit SecA